MNNADIICLTETFLSQDIELYQRHAIMKPSTAYRNDRRPDQRQDGNPNRGGILFFCRPHFQAEDEEILQFPDLECLSVTIVCPPIGPLRVCTIYRRPTVKTEVFNQQIRALLEDLQEKPTIILGDFNEDLLKPSDHPTYRLMQSFGYRQVVKTPTTDQGSLLDHCYIAGIPATVTVTVHVWDTYYSDHDIVSVKLQ